jgi:predicted transcriptional regulator
MKQFRVQVVLVALVITVAPCGAAKPGVRDGSTIEKAIPLRQRGLKAVEEEMAWMNRLYKYTPILSTRDAFAEAMRQVKAGQKEGHAPQPWSHAIYDHAGQCCSYYWFRTPRGRKEIYFDTGVSINISGEVQRQLQYRINYIQKAVKVPKS